MGRTPVLDALEIYVNENNVPFSMPGHKSGRGFKNAYCGRDFNNILLAADITEVEGLDNLHNPEGILKEAQEMLSELYCSKRSYFLVNGSTSGNLSMIFSSFQEGDKIIVERNCHRSVLNGIIMRKLKPIYLKDIMSDRYNAPISIDMEHFLNLLSEHDDIKGIIVTYPNYYGIAWDLKCVIEVCKKRDIKVLVDCAHGAHFGISPLLPENPMKLGADMAVMSAHKTLPSLTQTAYLHINDKVDEIKTDFYVSAFSSTSPSYLFMASMDYARNYLEERGRYDFEQCMRKISEYKNKINQLEKFHALCKDDIVREYPNYNIMLDESRLVISAGRGYNGHKILHYLRSLKIQCEMSDGVNIIVLTSPFNTDEDYESLYAALKECDLEQFIDRDFNLYIGDLPEQILSPSEVFNYESELLKLEDSAGRISAVNIVPYPPGVPIIMMGEIIEKNAIDVIQYYIKNDADVLGVKDNRISVVKYK